MLGEPQETGGYAFAYSPCIVCRLPFTYHPHRVPSTSAVTGKREPICRGCFDQINAKRRASGLDPVPLLPDAYGLCPESDL